MVYKHVTALHWGFPDAGAGFCFFCFFCFDGGIGGRDGRTDGQREQTAIRGGGMGLGV